MIAGLGAQGDSFLTPAHHLRLAMRTKSKCSLTSLSVIPFRRDFIEEGYRAIECPCQERHQDHSKQQNLYLNPGLLTAQAEVILLRVKP